MFVDSHCHLNFPELKSQLPDILARMADAKVTAAFITPDGRPRRQPPAWMNAFQRLLPESPDMIEESKSI